MHIRRLELQGFKSFKDKTVINFDDGITGIVGPNGCGKSNVVDAFFWVMGEQNARHLRGQNMDDLIFSGADKAPPASSAEVTLTLDMPAEISGPNAPAGASSTESLVSLPTREVAITRKLYRTGESDYFINKTPCRLRDIQELFMDTGVGARGYSIIQQGQIQKIVQAKPEDRRTMIEEVAGIVKYKARRKESTRKLEATQQNLLRVTDVINELEIQKRQMERQADKARKYKEWKEKLQGIELRFNALRWEDLANRIGVLEMDIERLTHEDIGLSTARESAETQIAQKRLELAQATKIAEEFQQKWIETGNKLNNTENDLKYSQKTIEDLQGVFAQLEQDTAEERALIESLTQQKEELAAEAGNIEVEFVEADEARKTQEALAQERRREADETERALEATSKRLYEVGAELERARSTAQFAEQRIAELAESLARVAQDRIEREEFVAEARVQREAATERLEGARADHEATRSSIKQANETVSNHNRELSDARRELSRLTSEQARMRTTLQTLEEQKRRHEDSSKGVKSVFQKIVPERADLAAAVRGTLADMLQVDSGMETAAEAALGKALDWVLTNDANQHAALSAALKEGSLGRAAFADIRKLAAQGSSSSDFSAPAEFAADVAGPLSNFVRLQSSVTEEGASALLSHLLANVIVLNSAAHGPALSERFPGFTFVTNEGESFRSGWFMEGGDKSSVSGNVVGRNREIAELAEKVEEITAQIEAMQVRIGGIEESIQQVENEKRASEEKARAQQSEISGFVSEEAQLVARLNEAEKALAKMLQEDERAQAEQQKLAASEREARQNIFAFETEKGALDVETARLGEVLLAARTAMDAAQQTLVDARVKAANLGDQKASLETRKRQNQNALDQHKNRIDSMIEQAKRRQAEGEETRARIENLSVVIEEQRAEMIAAETDYRAARDRFDILNNEVEEQRTAVQEHSTKERAIKDTLMSARLEYQKLTGDRDSLSQNTFERYGLMLAEYSMMPETMEQVQLLRDAGEGTIMEIQNEVTLLKEKIRKLGDINPAAVEEYDAIVERYNLLSSQRADLEKAMNDLQSTVDRINKVSKERFERAFHETNEHFKRVFPVIFGGGHAQLTLTNPEDMLETGVDITAQPPGKKPQNINLLSGGEKTLTALSLLFSIFLVKPSPFCLLDEVDAPLDDANIGRFNALLREMSKRSQFIIITHNKRTMELNDKLYGVTMEDAGVSKMVSIQLSASA